MTTPSTWFTPQQCVDIVRFYETRMTRELFSFIPDYVKEQKAKTTFLDVGPGAGILTKQLARICSGKIGIDFKNGFFCSNPGSFFINWILS